MSSALQRLRELEEQKRSPASDGGRPPSRRRQGVGAVIAALLVFLVLKGKWVLLVLLTKGKLLFGALKLGQLATTSYTMALAAWAFALYYGWSLAIGLVLLILIHEIGHGVAASRVGLRVGAPMFIPFVGAFIALRDRPRSTSDEAVVAAGGPIAGALASGATVAIGSWFDGAASGLLFVVGFYALVLNLFNLTPFWQLDGARMLAPVSPRVTLVGGGLAAAVLAGAASYAGHIDPVALIAVAVGLWRGGAGWWRARRGPRRAASALQALAATQAAASAVPDVVAPALRLRAAVLYFAALASLIVAVHVLRSALPALPG